MSEWRDDVQEERPFIGLGQLDDGDALEVEFTDEGEMTDTENGQALKLGAEVLETPERGTLVDLNGNEIETGDSVYILSSSSRFMSELAKFMKTLTGQPAEIEVTGTKFSRHYDIR